MEEHQAKPLKNIANVLGRTDITRRLVLKTENAIPAYPFEIRKFEKGASVILCPEMENEETSVDELPSKFDSTDTGNDFENLGHSQLYAPKSEGTLLLDIDRSDVTSCSMTTEVQCSNPLNFELNVKTVYKLEEDVPTPLNNATLEKDSPPPTSIALNNTIAVVETENECCDKNPIADCDSEADKISYVVPTSLINTHQEVSSSSSVLELDYTSLSAGEEICGQYSSVSNCVSEQEHLSAQLDADSSLRSCDATCPPLVSDIGNELSTVNCPDQEIVVTFSEAINNEKFKAILTEKDESSPTFAKEWKRELNSSTPCQQCIKISPQDDCSNACQILSTPKANRNICLNGKKIDFNEIADDQNGEYLMENLENLPVNLLENASVYNKTENVKIVLDIKQKSPMKKNLVKTSETFCDNTSIQRKRPASPESEKIKRSKCNDSSKQKIIEIDLTAVQTEGEDQKINNDKSKKESTSNFVSNDPRENEDNNNPDWEFLKKLETDDERYKAVRKRWRNLVIPDPNKNLTCVHRKSTFKHPNLCRRGADDKKDDENARCSRKRTLSQPTTSTDRVPVKRMRTQSCTTLYELKVKDINKKMEQQSEKLSAEKRNALANTNNYYYKQYMNLMSSNLRYHNNWEFQNRIAILTAAERKAEEAVHRDYSGAFNRLENENHSQALVFKKAMKEVEAFHKFYRKLEDSSKNDCFFLTDVELDDVMATDKLYEQFNIFYS